MSGPIQIQDTQVDQSSLGCLNATSVTQTGAIYPGLDGVFPIVGILPTNSPAGSMDTSANPLLFSEAMAQAENHKKGHPLFPVENLWVSYSPILLWLLAASYVLAGAAPGRVFEPKPEHQRVEMLFSFFAVHGSGSNCGQKKQKF